MTPVTGRVCVPLPPASPDSELTRVARLRTLHDAMSKPCFDKMSIRLTLPEAQVLTKMMIPLMEVMELLLKNGMDLPWLQHAVLNLDLNLETQDVEMLLAPVLGNWIQRSQTGQNTSRLSVTERLSNVKDPGC